MKDKKILIGTSLVLLLLLTTGLSYAYFSTAVKGNGNAKDMVVEAGTLKLTYIDGPAINVQNIKPGWSTTKEVSVKNNGTLDAYYNIIWQSLTNGITNDELVLSATCQRLNASGTVEGTCESIPQVPISDMTIAKKISIESGITHKYTFTILFKEINADQNYNQGKEFNGVLGIEEYINHFAIDSWDTIIANVKSGNIDTYSVGDVKEIELYDYGVHTLRIANMSAPSECNTDGFSQTACGFVIEFADIIATKEMNWGTYQGKNYQYGWNIGGWPECDIYSFLNEEILYYFPEELVNAIIDTMVVSSYGSKDTENFISTDKLYLLSTAEIWADAVSSSNSINVSNEKSVILRLAADIPACGISCDKARNVTRQLDYYKNLGVTTINNYSEAIKKNGTTVSDWWLRSSYNGSNVHFFNVCSDGEWCYTVASYEYGVSPAFRIG